MKEKLQEIKKTLLYYGHDANNNHKYKSLMGIDDTIRAKASLALIDSILAEMDSPELVEKVAVAMKKKDDELLSTGWGGRMDWHKKVGKAAIEAITV